MFGAFAGLLNSATSFFVFAVAIGVSMFGGSRTIVVAPFPSDAAPPGMMPQLALVAHPSAAAIVPSPATTTTTTAKTVLVPGLLPKVKLGKIASTNAPSASTASAKQTAQAKPAAVSPPTPTATSPFATADAILENATTSLTQRGDGTYDLVFNDLSRGRAVFSFAYGATPIGGTGGVPQFSADYSCNPPPDPNFDVRTNYDCTVSLTPTTGTDHRIFSKDYTFATGPGAFSASPPGNMNTHLSGNENDGGFVFANSDAKPITVLSETFNISYVGLATTYGPLVLRLVDPADATHYLDYHMEDFASSGNISDPAAIHAATGVTLSWPLTVSAANAKMLPLQILGVQKLSVAGVNPTITITLVGVTTDRSDITMRIGMPQISWSCIVPTGYYDPNATSGPFANGTACQN